MSAHEIEKRTNTDIVYMYLARMRTPCFRTFAKFKANFSDLISESFKLCVKLADEDVLLRIYKSMSGDFSIEKLNSLDDDLEFFKEKFRVSMSVDKNTDTDCI